MSELKPFQTEIEASTLYAVAHAPTKNRAIRDASDSQITPNIQVAGNAGDVYGSQVQPDSPPTNMTLIFDGLLNIAAFPYIPNFLYVDPVGSDPTAIILSAVSAEEVP